MLLTAMLCVVAFIGAAIMTPDQDDEDDGPGGGTLIPATVPTP